MRRLIIANVIAAIWIFGWLTGTFGFLPALLAAVIFSSPSFFAWRMTNSKRAVKRREYCYLAVLAALAWVSTAFIVVRWYDTGLDRLVIFEREYQAFRRQIANLPEFGNVEISYTLRKGGRVYLHGAVATKDSHDRLVQMIDRMIRHNKSGYYDGVEFPNKRTVGASRPGVSNVAMDGPSRALEPVSNGKPTQP